MTTDSPRATDATSWWGRCGSGASTRAGVITAGAVLLVVTWASRLYFVNLYGPLPDSAWLGWLASLGCGTAAAAVVFSLTRWAARRSRFVLVVVVGVLGAAGWVLLPRQIDVLESWVAQPNPRWSCSGWSFRYYPLETFDAAATVYCIGLEGRIADG